MKADGPDKFAAMTGADPATTREDPGMSAFTRPATAKNVGAGPLQMMIWLDRTPESFVPGFRDAYAPRFKLRRLGTKQILRFDTKALYAAVDALRRSKGVTWNEVAVSKWTSRARIR
jgi:hypothetical protein